MTPSVLFGCARNGEKSQMAEGPTHRRPPAQSRVRRCRTLGDKPLNLTIFDTNPSSQNGMGTELTTLTAATRAPAHFRPTNRLGIIAYVLQQRANDRREVALATDA
jgi:hypothetical protein